MTDSPLRILFLCTGNSARSQMAEALLRHFSKGRVAVFSAGSLPEADIHPVAREILELRYGIDTSGMHPKPISQFAQEQFDYVITVCDRVAERCPIFPNDPQQIHWSFEDPAAFKDPDAQRRAFENVAAGIAGRLRIWMALPSVRGAIED